MNGPRIAVDGIVLKDERIALVYRKNEPRGWALPGGHVEEDETLESAVKREIKEETGLDVGVENISGPTSEFGVYDSPERDPRKRMISVVFICKIFGGDLMAETDAKKAKLFPLGEASEMDLKFDHSKILEDFLKFREN